MRPLSTSTTAPVWAAITALLNDARGTNLGFANPLLYPLANTNAFHSAASMGSDFAHVGLGSPNVSFLHRALAGETPGAVIVQLRDAEGRTVADKTVTDKRSAPCTGGR